MLRELASGHFGILTVLVIWLVLINITSFIAYGADKRKAKKKAWRTPEAVLIALAAIGGGLGAFLGMQIFRHKTKHLKFVILVPLFLILWTIGLFLLFFCAV